MHHWIELKETAASTGYFSAVPHDRPTLEAGLAYLCQHPNDSFMCAHLLECIGEMDLRSVLTLLKSETGNDPVLGALLREAAAVYEHLSVIKEKFK